MDAVSLDFETLCYVEFAVDIGLHQGTGFSAVHFRRPLRARW